MTRPPRRGLLALLIGAALVVATAAVSAPPQVTAATAIVGNGLTTTDLNAVGMNPSALATELAGPGVTVSNVTYHGANAQAGKIHVVDPAVVSFNDGVILSSGNIADVIGPNKSDSTTGDMGGGSDSDLNTLIANSQTVVPMTYDAASLEFDFVPTANQVYFTYTFGSDEYLEWVNLFNDVFAFYVNGQNCATVPGGAPVSIDTINSTVNPNLFRDNSFSSPPANPINIEPDGLSVEMICTAPVQAGQTNHLKLAIADTSDQILDSVVMIRAQSLSTTKPESCNDGVDNNDDGKVDDGDPLCQATTTPPPKGSGGIGTGGSAPAFTGNEGTPIPLDASVLGWKASPSTISTSWTVHGINGTVGTCTIDPPGPTPLNADKSIPVAWASCPNDGEYVARVDGWDVEGGGSYDNDVDFFVHNAPPAVTIDAPTAGSQVDPNVPVSVSATVTDPGVSDTTSCSISWGDGTSDPGTLDAGVCSGEHVYASLGPVVLSVTATDDAGASAAAAAPLTVAVSQGVLAGSLTDATSGAPVAGVTVRVWTVGSASSVAETTSAADGSYSLALDPGTYQLQMSKTGAYLPVWASGSASRSSATLHALSAGQTIQVDQALTATRSISGTVTSSTNGAPVALAGVWAYRNGTYSGQHAITDLSGHYSLSGLTPGTWQIRVTHMGYLDQWFSGSPDLVGSSPVVVTSSNAPVADFALYVDPPSAATVAGTIVDSTSGLPVANAYIRIWKDLTDSYLTVRTDALGHYVFTSVPAATYRLQVAKAGSYQTRWWTAGSSRASATPFTLTTATNQIIDLGIAHL